MLLYWIARGRSWFGLYEAKDSFIHNIGGFVLVARIPRHRGRKFTGNVRSIVLRQRFEAAPREKTSFIENSVSYGLVVEVQRH